MSAPDEETAEERRRRLSREGMRRYRATPEGREAQRAASRACYTSINPPGERGARTRDPDCRTTRFQAQGVAGLLSDELEEHRRRGREKMRKWRERNRPHVRAYQQKRLEDPLKRLAQSIRSRLSNALRRVKVGKPASTEVLQGCSFEELMTHLASLFLPNMSWENYGKWHVDHKIALSKFDLADPEQLRTACNWRNLQPMWGLDNLSKGAR